MTVLITGGTGKTGRRLADRLRAAGVDVRVAARTPPTGPEGVHFDWNDRKSWAASLDGATAAYLVPPAGGGDVAATIAFIQAAVDRGVRRFVLLSASLLPAGGPGAGQVHAWLRDNAAEWAVLRPSWFMENFSEGQHRATIQDEGRIYSATGDGRVGFIAADDIAATACAALTRATAPDTDLVVTGPAALSYDEAAAILGQVAGRAVTHVRISIEALAARHRAAGLPPAMAAILAGMDGLIASGAEDRTTSCVEDLTGAAPTAFAAFCRANATAWARG
jgi:ergot alkaloid biosynthesis protein